MKLKYISNVWGLRIVFVIVCSVSCSVSELHPLVRSSVARHENQTAISEFRLVNRRYLFECADVNPYRRISVSTTSDLSDDGYVNVTVSGVVKPSESDWIAMISPSASNIGMCPTVKLMYLLTGDTSSLPLICHYPVKAQVMSNDPDYIGCKKSECALRSDDGGCLVTTCSATLSFHVINIRTDIEFVFFSGGFLTPCILNRTSPISFKNPNMPLYGHLASTDSTATSMRLTWVSGDKEPQQVQYGGKSETSQVVTFTPDDMCSFDSPARDFGWHDPGYIHSAVMTGLEPSTEFSYKYGSNSVGWSEEIKFKTPPGAESDELMFLAFGDMGKAPLDSSVEHYIQPGAISVVKAMTDEVNSGNVDSIFHIGDISYATGFLVEWDYFLHLIAPMASRLSYMTAIGNHERDYPGSKSVYGLTDSGGECGVPYEAYFPMPTSGKDKPWYSIEQGGVHFTVISTENDWAQGSEQYKWMQNDLASVNRTRTPWLIFTGHRPVYTTAGSLRSQQLTATVEPLLIASKVDLVLVGHVHNYERTCAVEKDECRAMPVKDGNGIDTYDHSNYTAPVHAVIGMGGFKLKAFPNSAPDWSLVRISKYGYLRAHVTKKDMSLQFVNSNTREVEDSFRITK